MVATHLARLLGLLLGVTACTGQTNASGPATVVNGTVRDIASGEPLANANLTVLGTTWGTISLEDGSYTIAHLPPGTYRVLVQMMGYQDGLEEVRLEPGRTERLDFSLRTRIVAVLEPVEVTGEKPLLHKDASTINPLDEDIFKYTPMDDTEEVLATQVGVIAQAGELHVRGGRGDELQIRMDGLPVGDPLGGGSPSLATGALAGAETILGGMEAKYGNALSGVVLLRTKEGGERFSGEVRYTTDDYGSPKNTFDNYDRLFLGVGGPAPVRNLTYYLSIEATYQDDAPNTVERRPRRKVLNFISVGDRKSNDLKLQGKLVLKASPGVKLTLEHIRQEERSDRYFHPWSRAGYVQSFLDTTRTGEVVRRHGRWSAEPLDSTYTYYNAAEHTPNSIEQFESSKLAMHHVLSQSVQYSLKLGLQQFHSDNRVLDRKEWEYEGQRIADYWYNYRDNASYDFFVTNGDFPALTTRTTRVYQAIGDVTIRRGVHTIETGFAAQYNDMRLFSLQYPWLVNENGEIGSPRTRYHYYNPEGALYLQDRWEHEGMIVNLGLRYDGFSVGNQVPLSKVQQRAKRQISPRVGVAYPISDRDVFSFHYGRLYQIPGRQYLFDDLDTFEGTRGNPNLTNQTTVAYQAAVQHLFSTLMAAQFSVYYKDIFGLITAEEVLDWSGTGTVKQYINRDYASSKGFEVSLSRGYANNMRWNVNYSYGNAFGVGSDPDGATGRTFAYLPNREVPLDWDARHSLNAGVYVGDRKCWGVSLQWSYITGQPYTPEQRDTRDTDPAAVNSRRMPSTTGVDVRVDKYYQLWGRQLSLFLQARNLLDAMNITSLAPGVWPAPPVESAYVVYYTETGRVGGAYLADRNGDGVEEFVPLHDPRVFGERRTVRVGVGYEF